MNYISPYVQLGKNAIKCQIQMTIEMKSTNVKLKNLREIDFV
jgi:hypothetical protein